MHGRQVVVLVEHWSAVCLDVRARELQPMFARASGLGAGAELEKSKAHGRRHRWCGHRVVPSKPSNFRHLSLECIVGLDPFKILHRNDSSTFYHLMQFARAAATDIRAAAASPHARKRGVGVVS